MSRSRLIALVVAALVPAECYTAEHPRPQPWETCSLTERKGDGCDPGDQPRAFEQYLVAGPWAKPTHPDWFWVDFDWNVKYASTPPHTTWREVGSFGPHRIRNVRFLDGNSVFADLLLAENSPGIFSPLMKWSGQMPDATFYDAKGTQVLVVARDWGGNVPMVQTFAWIWAKDGPVRLDVTSAMHEAFHALGPRYSGYDSGLNWTDLSCRTPVWNGDYPGKIEVSEEATIWFEIRDTELVVKNCELGKPEPIGRRSRAGR